MTIRPLRQMAMGIPVRRDCSAASLIPRRNADMAFRPMGLSLGAGMVLTLAAMYLIIQWNIENDYI